MRKIEPTTQFKKDYKRESKGCYRLILDELLTKVIDALAKDKPLSPRYRDHALTGNWAPAPRLPYQTGLGAHLL